MTKLEEKLIELGYGTSVLKGRYIKSIEHGTWISVWLKKNKEEIEVIYITNEHVNTTQQDIDNLQQAFNEMQKDLKILKGVENEK